MERKIGLTRKLDKHRKEKNFLWNIDRFSIFSKKNGSVLLRSSESFYPLSLLFSGIEKVAQINNSGLVIAFMQQAMLPFVMDSVLL
jgi:hypothetical protein